MVPFLCPDARSAKRARTHRGPLGRTSVPHVGPIGAFGAVLSLLLHVGVAAQTDPAAQALPYAQDFSSLVHASTTYPVGWQGWTLGSALGASYITTVPTAITNLSGNGSAATTGMGVHNFNGKIGMMGSNTGGGNVSLVLAVNTTGFKDVLVSFSAMTIRIPSRTVRVIGLGLQYRVGTTGDFVQVTSDVEDGNNEYRSAISPSTTSGTTPMSPAARTVALPAACDDQPLVQLRWVLREVPGSEREYPSVAIGDVAVAGTVVMGLHGPADRGLAVDWLGQDGDDHLIRTNGLTLLGWEVLDVAGRTIARSAVPSVGGPHRVGLRGAPIGAYVVRLLTDHGTSVVRVTHTAH